MEASNSQVDVSNIPSSDTKTTIEEKKYISNITSAKNEEVELKLKTWQANKKVMDFEKQIKVNAYDPEAWVGLLHEALSTKSEELIRSGFIRFLEKFPTSAKYYKMYAEYEYQHQKYTELEEIFTKCLVALKSVELWVYYLNYIKEKIKDFKPDSKLTAEQIQTVDQSYTFALRNVGIDSESYLIWKGYIDFLSETEYFNPWEISKKNDKIRSIYQKAISIPINQIELIWKDYDSFENTSNKQMAKKQLSDWSATYMTARSVYRASIKYIEAINNYMPKDGLCSHPTWNHCEMNYLLAWKKYIEWQKANPQKIESTPELEKNIIFLYEKAVLALRFYPEIWVEAAQYLWSISKQKESRDLLNEASKIMPKSLSINFQLAEFEELSNNNSSCTNIFNSLLKLTQQDIEEKRKIFNDSITSLKNTLKLLSELYSGKDGKKTSEKAQIDDTDTERNEGDIELEDLVYDLCLNLGIDESELGLDFRFENIQQIGAEEAASQEFLHKKRKIEQLINRVEDLLKVKLNYEKRIHTQVWISYLRHSMRANGIDGARSVFKTVRTQAIENITYHIFVASAMMEYHVTKNPSIAGRLFEFGLKYFGSEPDYVLEYMEYLININDSNNSRALFERTVLQKNTDCSMLWNVYLNYEYQYGDLRTVYNLDSRLVSQDKSESSVNRFINRYGFLDLNPMRSVCFGNLDSFHEKDKNTNGAEGQSNVEPMASISQNNTDTTSFYNLSSLDNEVQIPSEELKSIAVGSIKNGKYLNRSLLLSSANVPNCVKPNFSLWDNYKPDITNVKFSDNYTGNKMGVGNNYTVLNNDQDNSALSQFDRNNLQNDGQGSINQQNLRLENSLNSYESMLLSNGDILGFLYSKVSSFPNLMLPSLQISALVDSVVNSPSIQPSISSSSLFNIAANNYISNQASISTSNIKDDGNNAIENNLRGGNQGFLENQINSEPTLQPEGYAEKYSEVGNFNQGYHNPPISNQPYYPKRPAFQGNLGVKNKTLHFGNRHIQYQSTNYTGFNPNNLKGKNGYFNHQKTPDQLARETQFQKQKKKPRFNN
ncbi:hypothetical protein BB561_001616 [Smittium simulii]|uniref:Suppressor of forked domain-containing protein n=1 Tax=Smittium simulii TaxID=133385 RepID=A0A2T9YTU5_9FUNG|nr:hypothetical protein BB561_003080 [Smittium simulii]PVU95772.1 hypothetical protein BB561_001616 [Smittium simulii]